MAARLIRHLGKGGPSSCVYKCRQLGCSYWNEQRALLSKTFGGFLETVVGQRIWLFPVWLTAVRIDRRQDLTCLFTLNLGP